MEFQFEARFPYIFDILRMEINDINKHFTVSEHKYNTCLVTLNSRASGIKWCKCLNFFFTCWSTDCHYLSWRIDQCELSPAFTPPTNIRDMVARGLPLCALHPKMHDILYSIYLVSYICWYPLKPLYSTTSGECTQYNTIGIGMQLSSWIAIQLLRSNKCREEEQAHHVHGIKTAEPV